MSTARTATAQKTATPTITAVPTRILQRQCECGAHAAGGECEDCKKQKGVLSRKASGHSASDTSAACEMSAMSPHLVAEALRSPGQPLDRDTRAFMESRFQHDFSAVRVHTDVRAAASARALRARAWALGSDVAFATGAYAPGTATGRRLLAHELTHVVQQERAPASVPSPDTDLNVSEPGDASEREADRVSDHVADSSPLVVRSQAAPDVIHRDWDDLSKGEKAGVIAGSVAGGIGLIAFFAWLASRKGPEDIDNEPQCGPRQNEKIVPAITAARQWVTKALNLLRAYKAHPRDPANQAVDAALKRRFRSTDAAVIEKIERVITQTSNVIASMKTFCHTKKHPTCDVGAAFAQHGKDEIHFCQSFYKAREVFQIGAIIHEVTHSLAGGAPIHDRGYEGERRFGGGTEPNRLSTEENLTNAESYNEFVGDLATGTIVGLAAPVDVIEGPDDWKEPVKETMSLVQRFNTNLGTYLSQVDPPPAQRLRDAWKGQNVPGDAPTLEVVKAAIAAVSAQLGGPIRIVCNADARVHCAQGDVDWNENSITLCASWKPKSQDARSVSLLAGLYGWIAKMDNAAWRTALAQIAADTVKDPQFAPASHEDVFGHAAWTPDLLRIYYQAIIPSGRLGLYEESGTIHQKHSNDTPTYTQPDCKKSKLPLVFRPSFFVDTLPARRPGPYSKPHVSVRYTHPKADGSRADVKREQDAVPSLTSEQALETTVTTAYNVVLDANGPFVVDLVLQDPDSKTTRTYHDEIKVEPVKPCPAAVTPAQPAGQAAPAAPVGAPGPGPNPAPITVQRAPDDTGRDVGIGLAIGGGVVGAGLVTAWLAGAFDSKKKPPDDKAKAGAAKTPPKPQTAAAPLPKISFDEALEEGANVLKPAFGASCGLQKGTDPTDGYDASEWREDPSRGTLGLALVATTASSWVAVDHMIRNIGKDVPKAGGGQTRWHFDCFEGVHVLRLYAYWRTMSQADFEKRFPTVEIGLESSFHREWKPAIKSKGPGKQPYVEGPPKAKPGIMNFDISEKPVNKSWAKLLAEAPVGSQVIWTNADAQRKCVKDPSLDFCAFQNENATKLGPDRYWAHPFGIVTEQQVKDKMSEAVIGRVSKTYIAQNIFISALRHPKEPPVEA
jgi:hypothetical protein